MPEYLFDSIFACACACRHHDLQAALDQRISELMQEMKVKSFEHERLRLVYDETADTLKKVQLEHDKQRAKLDVHTSGLSLYPASFSFITLPLSPSPSLSISISPSIYASVSICSRCTFSNRTIDFPSLHLVRHERICFSSNGIRSSNSRTRTHAGGLILSYFLDIWI